MTVSTETPLHIYTANGVTTEWSYTFTTLQNSDVHLIVATDGGVESEISSSDFTLDSVNKTVTYPKTSSGLTPVANGYKVVVYRQVTANQTLDLDNSQPYTLTQLETSYDKLTAMLQDVKNDLTRVPHWKKSEVPTSTEVEDLITDISNVAANTALALAAADRAEAAAIAGLPYLHAITDVGCACNGTTDDYSTLNTYFTTNTDACTLFIPSRTLIGTSWTVPTNIKSIIFDKSKGELSIPTAKAITFTGQYLDCSSGQSIFYGLGSCAGTISNYESFPNWFEGLSNGNNYYLVGNSKKVFYLDAMPTAGAFTIGDKIVNTSTSIAETGTTRHKYMIYGWLRKTNGSNHVLNTDWAELRLATRDLETPLYLDAIYDIGCACNGSTDDYSTLSNYFSINTGSCILSIPNTTLIGSDWSIPSNIKEISFPGYNSKFSVPTTKTLTFNNQYIDAPNYKYIFYGSGTYTGTILNEHRYPEWWGAKGDGSTDDIDAIKKAIAFKGIVKFRKATYKINSVIGEVDFRYVSLKGELTTFDCYNIATSPVIQITSTRSYPHFNNGLSFIKGISFIGGVVSGITCLLYGHATNGNNNDILIDQCVFDQFDTNIAFTHNSWRFKMTNSMLGRAGSYHLYVPNGLTNHGENMSISNCMFADGTGDALTSISSLGDWSFINCSFDNTPVIVSGGATVGFFAPHFENPGNSSAYTYLTLESGYIYIQGGTLVQNTLPNNATFDAAYFINNSTNIAGSRLVIENFYFPNTPEYNSKATEGHQVFCGGSGMTIARNIRLFSGVQTGSNFTPLLSTSINRLMNGAAELGNMNNWTVYGSGSVVADATAAYSGSYGFHMVGPCGFYQEFDVLAGQYVAFDCYAKTITGTIFYGLEWYDAHGTKLNSPSNGVSASRPTYTLSGYASGRFTPSGASKVRVSFDLATGEESYVDDVVLNII